MTTTAETILPPPSTDYEDDFRVPYANEMLLLSFEGHHRPFEIDRAPRGKRPSYAPGAESTSDYSISAKLLRLRARVGRI
jgi:hypothetical protein